MVSACTMGTGLGNMHFLQSPQYPQSPKPPLSLQSQQFLQTLLQQSDCTVNSELNCETFQDNSTLYYKYLTESKCEIFQESSMQHYENLTL